MTSTPSPSASVTQRSSDRPGGRLWSTVVIVGLIGQIAWTVENMYLNVFVYDTITPDPTAIATMVALSAIAATVATVLIGAWSDRVGRRRIFIAVGYLAWGVCTAAFGFFSPESGAVAAPYVGAALIGVIALDCVMSVFGSGANDAAFAAWVTDVTSPRNRGRIEGVLVIMPLVAMLVVFGALDGLTRAGEWRTFFGIVGAATALSGILAWFLVRDVPAPRRDNASMPARIIEGFRPSTVRAQPALYLSLLLWLIVGTASQVFLPYVIIYLQRWLQIESYALVLGASLIAASLISILGGRLMDRVGKRRMLLPATALFAAGLVAMFFAREMVPVILAASVALGGMMLAVASISATVRDETPGGRAGMVQGIRMVTAIMVPMIVGPFIGAAVISGAGQTYLELGVARPVPGPEIFIAAAIVLVLVPVAVVLRSRVERGMR